MVADPLLDAVAAAVAGAWPACLTALLAAWRFRREPALAEAIDRVAARVGREACAPREIVERIARLTDVDVLPLVELVRRQARTQPGFGAYAVALAKQSRPDPRVATLLAEFFERAPLKSRIGCLERPVLDALDAIDDPRFRDRIVAAADAYAPRRGRLVRRRAQIDHLVAVATRTRARAPAPALSATATDALARIDVELARRTRDVIAGADQAALLAAIYANPADDGARLVYADVLQQRGDPRGELIALQCARAPDAPPSARERALLVTHARPWLGAIEPVVQKQGVTFRRGFVASARLATRGACDALADPAWRTLEDLDLADGWGEDLAAWVSGLPALRRVYQLYADDVARVVATRVLPWTTLGFRYGGADEIGHLAKHVANLPAVVELDLSVSSPLAAVPALAGTPLLAQLRRVRAQARAPRNLELLVEAARVAAIPALELVATYGFPAVSTDDSVVLAGEHVTFVHRTKIVKPRYATTIVSALPAGVIRTASIEAPVGARVDVETRAALEAAMAARSIRWQATASI